MKRSTMRKVFSKGKRKGGFSLVEIVIAISIVGLAFLAILGTLSVGVTNDQASSQQTVATNIAASIMADLRSTPGNVASNGSYSPSTTSVRFLIPLPNTVTANSLAPLDGLAATVMYFDISAAFISPVNPGTVPANAVYVARVYPAMLGYVGLGPGQTNTSQYTYLVRINVAWPAQAPVAVGNTDVVTQYITH